jgi:hypothetical protein
LTYYSKTNKKTFTFQNAVDTGYFAAIEGEGSWCKPGKGANPYSVPPSGSFIASERNSFICQVAVDSGEA